jgi:hypothetical protein
MEFVTIPLMTCFGRCFFKQLNRELHMANYTDEILFAVILLAFAVCSSLASHYLRSLEQYLYKNYKNIWDEVTFKEYLFIKRENMPLVKMNHQIVKFIFSKSFNEDKQLSELKSKNKKLFLFGIILFGFLCIIATLDILRV